MTVFTEVKLKNLYHLLLVDSTKGINISPLYFKPPSILLDDR